jgi:polyisoprenoid-binding protein YceI
MKSLSLVLSVAASAGLLAALPARASTPPRAAESYAIDNGHSTVVFHTKHVGVSEAYGRFNKILEDKSHVVLDGDKSSITLVVDAASIDTNQPDRDTHLRSADFFSVKEFPEIVFESRKVETSGAEWKVTGDLTFHGVTKSVSAKARKVGAGEAFGKQLLGLVAEFTIDMNDFGIAMLKQNPTAVGPEVHLTVSLECARK